MAQKMNWDEIKKKFNEEWVLLEDYDWEETEIDPRAGIVRVHSKDSREFHRLILNNSVVDSAIVYVGEIFPNDNNIMLSPTLHQYADAKK